MKILKLLYFFANKLGLFFVVIDVFFWVIINIIGGGYLNIIYMPFYEVGLGQTLFYIWNIVHKPVNDLLLPYIYENTYAHRSDVFLSVDDLIYISASLLYIYLLGFILGRLIIKAILRIKASEHLK